MHEIQTNTCTQCWWKPWVNGTNFCITWMKCNESGVHMNEGKKHKKATHGLCESIFRNITKKWKPQLYQHWEKNSFTTGAAMFTVAGVCRRGVVFLNVYSFTGFSPWALRISSFTRRLLHTVRAYLSCFKHEASFTQCLWAQRKAVTAVAVSSGAHSATWGQRLNAAKFAFS